MKPYSMKQRVIALVQSHGFTPVIFTTREPEYIEQWLRENQFPSLEITNTKYPSWIYIDDRCLKFDGDYEKLLKDMKAFTVYREKKETNRFCHLN